MWTGGGAPATSSPTSSTATWPATTTAGSGSPAPARTPRRTTGCSTRSARASSTTRAAPTSAAGCPSCATSRTASCTSRGRHRVASRRATPSRSSSTPPSATWRSRATSRCAPVPEGHTLHRLARQQTALFAGRPVRVTSPQGRFAAGAGLLDGRVLDRVIAHGKHLFGHFGADVLHVHLGLYGTFTTGAGVPPPARGALRMRWVADGPDGAGVWTDLRGATVCEVLPRPEVAGILARLGPDPLRRGADGGLAFRRV